MAQQLLTREVFNARKGLNAQPTDEVTHYPYQRCGYDPRCAACWLGHTHTWADHDRALASHARQQQEWRDRLVTLLAPVTVGHGRSTCGRWVAREAADRWTISGDGAYSTREAVAARLVELAAD